MFGNYPVNDDWVFLWQVKAFSQGIFTLNAELDPSFVSQGLLGLAWSRIFGISYISLQVLTFLITLSAAFYVFKILKLLKAENVFAGIGALIVIFNPIVFASAFTFMTDNYFLFFLSASTYYFIKYFNTDRKVDLIVGSVFILLATMARQTGILVPFSLIITLIYRQFSGKKRVLNSEIIIPTLFMVISLLLTLFWPRFGANRRLIDYEDLSSRVLTLRYVPQYMIIFLSPLFLGLQGVFNSKRSWLISLPVMIICSVILFKSDIFPMGNVLYIEELYSKSDFRSNYSLFDNVFMKIFLAGIWSFGFSKAVYYAFNKYNKKITLLKPIDVFLILSAFLNIVILLFSSDIYDRYLLPSFLFLLIYFYNKFEFRLLNLKYLLSGIIVLAFISVFLQWEFYSKNTLMWRQLEKLRELTGLSTQIEFNDTYINHISVRESGDFTGLVPRKGSFEKLCYIQDYTDDASSDFFKKIELFNRTVSAKIIANPKPPEVRKKTVSRVKNNLDRLLYKDKYTSLVYGAVGKTGYVASWCVDEN